MKKSIPRKKIFMFFLFLLLVTFALFTVTPTQAQIEIANMTYLPLVQKDIVITPAPTPAITPTQTTNCDPSYPTVCIPPPPPDLDCGEIEFRNFTVLPPDPHGFDTDNDGIGCET